MNATLRAANADEIDDLILWLDDHPDDVDPLSRQDLAQWLVEFLRTAKTFPASTVVPEGALGVLDALIEDWAEVLGAHGKSLRASLENA